MLEIEVEQAYMVTYEQVFLKWINNIAFMGNEV